MLFHLIPLYSVALAVGIEIDPANKALWSALRAAEEAQEADRVSRHAAAAIERAQEDHRRELREASKKKKTASAPQPAPEKETERETERDSAAAVGDNLEDFFASLSEQQGVAPAAAASGKRVARMHICLRHVLLCCVYASLCMASLCINFYMYIFNQSFIPRSCRDSGELTFSYRRPRRGE